MRSRGSESETRLVRSKTFMREVDLGPDSPQRKSGDCPGQQFIPWLSLQVICIFTYSPVVIGGHLVLPQDDRSHAVGVKVLETLEKIHIKS